MYPISRLTQFNHALVYGFDPELSPVLVFEKKTAKNSLYPQAGQHIDMLNAYLYAQDTVLPTIKRLGIENVTPEMLLEWILTTHKHIGKHLLASWGGTSGQYSKEEIVRWQQGADVAFTISELISDVHFDAKANEFKVSYAAQYHLSQETSGIFFDLMKRYRHEVLKEPLQMMNLLGNKYEFVQAILSRLKDDVRKGSLTTVEQQALNKILIFGSPIEAIPELMRSFAVNTLKEWVGLKEKSLEEATLILAEIFYQLTHIHPFVNCNGRTATWLINVILKSQGSPDILLRYPGERNDAASDYEKAMACIDDTREPFSKHIFNCIQKAKLQPYQNAMLAQLITLRVCFSLRCQQLEKSSKFDYEIFSKASEKFIKIPDEKQVCEIQHIVLKQSLELLDQWEEKFLPKRRDHFISGSLHKNPLMLYKESLKYFETTQYARAIPLLEEALAGFKEKLGETSIESIKCYSTLVSAYRENRSYEQALSTCEKALCDVEILKSKMDENKAAEIDKLRGVLAKKYFECFYVLKQTPMDVYALALKNYHNKQHLIAIYQLQHCVQQWEDKQLYKKEISTAYSTMASCQRELGLLNEALSSCDLAKSVILVASSSKDACAVSLSNADKKKLELIENKRKTILTAIAHIDDVESPLALAM